MKKNKVVLLIVGILVAYMLYKLGPTLIDYVGAKIATMQNAINQLLNHR